MLPTTSTHAHCYTHRFSPTTFVHCIVNDCKQCPVEGIPLQKTEPEFLLKIYVKFFGTESQSAVVLTRPTLKLCTDAIKHISAKNTV